MRRGLLLLGSLILMTAPIVAAEVSPCKDFEPYFKIAGTAMAGPGANSAQAFALYRQVSSSAAGAANRRGPRRRSRANGPAIASSAVAPRTTRDP